MILRVGEFAKERTLNTRLSIKPSYKVFVVPSNSYSYSYLSPKTSFQFRHVEMELNNMLKNVLHFCESLQNYCYTFP